MVGFVDAFLNQFFRDIFLIFRTHRRNFLPGRTAWRVPVAVRFPYSRGLFRDCCSTCQVLACTSPVEIICFRAPVAARDLARPLLNYLRCDNSQAFRSTKDFPLLFLIHSHIQTSRRMRLAAAFRFE